MTQRRLSTSLRLRVYLRSLALQGSWNNQRMQNMGLLTTLLPWLHLQKRDLNKDRVFCRRYFEFFNTNPYLANYVIGGLLRLEHDRAAGVDLPPDLSTSFRDSLGRAFSSMGDQLFWWGLRPALVMGTCLLGLHGQMSAIILVVGLFAIGQLVLRWRSLATGYRMGFDLVDVLQQPRWHRAIAVAGRVGMVLTGMTAGTYLAMVSRPGLPVDHNLLWFGVATGFTLPILLRRRLPGEFLILLSLGLALLMAFAVLWMGS